MEDNQIVDLYWNRDTDAIKESSKKYGDYCFSVANNILHIACRCHSCACCVVVLAVCNMEQCDVRDP